MTDVPLSYDETTPVTEAVENGVAVWTRVMAEVANHAQRAISDATRAVPPADLATVNAVNQARLIEAWMRGTAQMMEEAVNGLTLIRDDEGAIIKSSHEWTYPATPEVGKTWTFSTVTTEMFPAGAPGGVLPTPVVCRFDAVAGEWVPVTAARPVDDGWGGEFKVFMAVRGVNAGKSYEVTVEAVDQTGVHTGQKLTVTVL